MSETERGAERSRDLLERFRSRRAEGRHASGLVAFGLFFFMIGLRTEQGPSGALEITTRFRDASRSWSPWYSPARSCERWSFGRGPILLGRAVPSTLARVFDRREPLCRSGALALRAAGAGAVLSEPLPARSRHPGADLRDAGLGPEHRGRPRRPARSRLCRVLRGRRLFLRAAGDPLPPVVLDLPAARRHLRRVLGRPARLSRCCGFAATISPSSHSRSARSSGSCCSTGRA